MSYPKPSELWDMSPENFNKWRQENDLKILFQRFQENLPFFDDWLQDNNLTVNFILSTNNPGHFFYWDKETYCIRSQEKSSESYFFIPVDNEKHDNQIQKTDSSRSNNDESERFKFKPYFFWVKEKHKISNPIKTQFSGNLDTFRYTSGVAPDVPDMCSWAISGGGTVLKLGGVKIDGWFKLNSRNLDFVNLDYLEIEGDVSWSTSLQIFYSHCEKISMNNVSAQFTEFYHCSLSQLNVFKSRIYWLEFYRCDIFKAYFENSIISNMIIEEGSINSFSFNRVEVDNIIYIPPTKEYHSGVGTTYKTVSDNYKRFRILYQANGLRLEASNAYFKERYFEMKSNWKSINLCEPISYLLNRNLDYSISSVRRNFQKLIKYFSDVFSYLIWGFGERPVYTIFCSILILSIYTVLYYISDIQTVGNNLTNSLYLSSIMFTTLGFGDFTPFQSGEYKLLLASEALLGAFTFGLFIAGYANKSKY